MNNMPIYLAIYDASNGAKYLIEYRPLWDTRPAGGIEIVSITATRKPQDMNEIREVSRSANSVQLEMLR